MTHGAFINLIISTTESGTHAMPTCRGECTVLVMLYLLEEQHIRNSMAASGANYVGFSCNIFRHSFTILLIRILQQK
jgi:hypothetical protein